MPSEHVSSLLALISDAQVYYVLPNEGLEPVTIRMLGEYATRWAIPTLGSYAVVPAYMLRLFACYYRLVIDFRNINLQTW